MRMDLFLNCIFERVPYYNYNSTRMGTISSCYHHSMAYRDCFPRSKYGARKVQVDGVTFDSEKEYRRWCELKIMEKAGLIAGLERQVSYELIPSQYETKPDGGRGRCIERSASYIADFVYKDKDGKVHVEDAKGMRTKEYVLKRKLMLHVHGIRIEEV